MTQAPTSCRLDIRHFSSATEQAAGLARAVADQLRAALSTHGVASLAVSGGRSPIPFFEQLRQYPLPWSQVYITLVDERCVPAGHVDSNARLVREHLLQGPAAAAHFVDWLTGVSHPEHYTPSALVEHATARLQRMPWPLDVVVLGMGEDGHTASWFPESPGLAAALGNDAALAWVRPVHAPHLRLTLTLGVVTTCNHLHLAIAGSTKRQVLAAAQAGRTPSSPIQILLAHAPDMQAWIAD